MSQAHLIPERIREYALKVEKVLKGNPVVDRNVQLYYELLCAVEYRLKKEPMDSCLFQETLKKTNGKDGLEALRKGDKNWIEKRFHKDMGYMYRAEKLEQTTWFPFFFTYVFDNNLDSHDALISLATHFKIPVQDDLQKVEINHTCPPEDNKKIFFSQYDEYTGYSQFQIEGKRFENYKFLVNGLYPLFNSQMLNISDIHSPRPVFIAESFTAAAELESDVWINHIQVLSSQLVDDIEKEKDYLVEKQKTFFNLLKTRNELQNSLKEFTKSLIFNPKYSLGDVIWVSPVGGYAVPWKNDFSVLSNRDIYIFKMHYSNLNNALLELLDVYACLPPHEGHKIRFILLSRQVSALPSENPIKICDINDIFSLCSINSVPIPETLKQEYDQYLRDCGKQRSPSRFIIKPFLRKNSWILLSGEEGSGKSFIAMALGFAIVAKGKLFNSWAVCGKKNKVLYVVDDEMSDDVLAERLNYFRRMYRKNENFITEPVHALNLLVTEGQQELEHLIANAAMKGDPSLAVNVVILDHLLKLTGAEGDQRDYWPKVRTLIEDLTQRGIAVILVHHEYGNARMLGTRLIANDAHARIHLKRIEDPETKHIAFGISIPKNRGGKDQQVEKRVTLVLTKTPHWLDDNQEEKDWKQYSSKEKTKIILEMKNQGKTVKDIAYDYNVSKSTIEKWITGHPELHRSPKMSK